VVLTDSQLLTDSMSTMRVPPNMVSITTIPGGPLRTSPMMNACFPEEVFPHLLNHSLRSCRADYREEFACVADIQRIQAKDFASTSNFLANRKACLVNMQTDVRTQSDLIESRADAAALGSRSA
jgi:hypothetical protein